MIVFTQQVFCGEIEASETIQFDTVEELIEFMKHQKEIEQCEN
jgi:hypothetical protein